jgi:hypothetical protein
MVDERETKIKSKFEANLTDQEKKDSGSMNYSNTFKVWFHENREEINSEKHFNIDKVIKDLNATEEVDIEFLKEGGAEFVVSRNESAKLCNRPELIVTHNIEDWRIDKYKKNYYDEGRDKVLIEDYKKHTQNNNCFIATATFDSPLANEVVLLKDWRDRYLLKTNIGRIFVESYYLISPPIANYIKKSKILKSISIILIKSIIKVVRRRDV